MVRFDGVIGWYVPLVFFCFLFYLSVLLVSFVNVLYWWFSILFYILIGVAPLLMFT